MTGDNLVSSESAKSRFSNWPTNEVRLQAILQLPLNWNHQIYTYIIAYVRGEHQPSVQFAAAG